MGRIIPNENSWIGWSETVPSDPRNPSAADVAAAEDLTCLISTINASAQGNAIPTPDICTLFEKSVPGTSTATFTADLYRDDVADLGWDALKRNVKGVFYISRFGGSGTDRRPQDGESVEVWPVHVTSRTAAPLASNTPQTFTVTCSVPEEPAEDAVVGATIVRTLTATPQGGRAYEFTLLPAAYTKWDFGDGYRMTTEDGNAHHTFPAGAYTVRAQVGYGTVYTYNVPAAAAADDTQAEDAEESE